MLCSLCTLAAPLLHTFAQTVSSARNLFSIHLCLLYEHQFILQDPAWKPSFLGILKSPRVGQTLLPLCSCHTCCSLDIEGSLCEPRIDALGGRCHILFTQRCSQHAIQFLDYSRHQVSLSREYQLEQIRNTGVSRALYRHGLP